MNRRSTIRAIGYVSGDKETIVSVRRTAKQFNAPVEILRRRVIRLLDVNCKPTGPHFQRKIIKLLYLNS